MFAYNVLAHTRENNAPNVASKAPSSQVPTEAPTITQYFCNRKHTIVYYAQFSDRYLSRQLYKSHVDKEKSVKLCAQFALQCTLA